MKTCKEKALEWNVSPRSVNDMCKKGRIQGAIKEKGSWLIPDDSPKPMDGRVSNGKYIKKNMVAKAEVKSLPIGISDYVRAQEEYYYVDKTLLIKEFLDQKPLVSLFTRPRRFGKTLNMDMLRVFFEISDKNTSKYFADKNIWQCGEEYRSHQGKYPVIFLTFKDVKFDTWDATIDKIRGLLQEEYGRHQELLNSDKLAQYEKEYFTKIISATANEVELTSSLERLSKMLASHYDKAPVIIIDEYDTPIQEGYSKDFYDEIIGFMRNFFSGAFKDNKNLSYGFLTGILRIAQESIFSGLNNLTVNSVMDEEYDSFFGFTESEVKAMLSYYGVSDKEEELKDWYDGYLFGSEEIYNPWSVINYISKGCLPQAYWVNTRKNEILDDVLRVATDDITERLYDLLQGERVVARIDQNVVYRSLAEDPANIYSLLLVAGYLKTPKKELQADGSYLCEVSIPNREIAAVYKSEILSHFLQTGAITRTTANKIAESLYANDYKKLQSAIGEYMDKSISFFDGGAEGFYHGLMLGLIALIDNQYKIKSNRESGDGRFDVSLIPREKRYPGIILELKWKEKLSDVDFINIPDLLSCDTRSWDGANIAKAYFDDVVPHLRAMDFDFTKELPIKDKLREYNIKEVLVIEGDPPQSMLYQVYPTISTDIIKKFSEEMPEITVYAGIDQYRSSMKEEEYRIRRKQLAGAKGFFTQPFFDMRYLEMYADLLDGLDIYWGVSPVLSERSVSYWRNKNNVIFPKDFEPTLEWNIEFARKVIDFARKHNHNVYLMPIKAKIMPYLEGVFAK